MRGPQANGGRGGGFANRGRRVQTALLRSAFVPLDKTNSARRIQKDLKELQENKHQIVGVSLAPAKNSIYEYCGNIAWPEDYYRFKSNEKPVFHFWMTLPENYPVGPPDITFKTPISHPNVYCGKVCFDMLQVSPKQKFKGIYEGWVPAYTLEAVLLQLQSFISESNWINKDYHYTERENRSLLDRFQGSKNYRCERCDHNGWLEPCPPFLRSANAQIYRMKKTSKDLLLEELLCYHTKTPLREATLGVGISLKKSIQTNEFKYVNPTMDLINMRAFTKLKVRTALEKETYTHWLPLYFGENEQVSMEEKHWNNETQTHETKVKTTQTRERFEHHFYNSLAFIMNKNVKKPISPESILQFFPKLITTHIVDLCKENRFTSIVSIRRLFNFMRLFFMCIEKFPEIGNLMDAKLKEFIEDPEKRVKEFQPNLGDLLVYSLMSSTYDFEDIKEAYLGEQLDRQVFFMLLEVPELDFQNTKIKNHGMVDEKVRNEVCFECGKVGNQIACFFSQLNECIRIATVSNNSIEKNLWPQLSKQLDGNHGCLDLQHENMLQKQLKIILKMKTFKQYFKNLKMPNMGDIEVIGERLIQAVKNSREKGYHNDDLDQDSLIKLPTVPEQSQDKVMRLLNLFTDITSEQVENVNVQLGKRPRPPGDDDVEMQIVEVQPKQSASITSLSSIVAEPYKAQYFLQIKQMLLKNSLRTDDDWKEICIQYFPFVNQELHSNKDRGINAAKLAQMHDDMELYKYSDSKKHLETDHLAMKRRALLNQDIDWALQNYTVMSDYDSSTFTYKKLMVKLCFEELVKNLALNYNFEIIYEFLKLFVTDLETIKFQVLDSTYLKSGNYYLMTIISKLTSLKKLKLYKDYDAPEFSQSAIKFLKKAFSYFYKNNGKLIKFEFGHGIVAKQENLKQGFLYNCLKHMPNLLQLKITKYELMITDAKAIGRHIQDNLNLMELDLTDTNLTSEHAKEIADGLMRAKNLEVIKLKDNQELDCSQIVYNLAFAAKIKHIDLTRSCTKIQAKADSEQWPKMIESLYRLLKISGSIESVLFGETPIAKYLSLDFSKALGESTSLKYLNFDAPLSWIQKSKATPLQYLFKGIAMNAYKQGNFQSISLIRGISGVNITNLFANLFISDQDHEEWYGDPETAKKMEKEQLDKKLCCKLLDLNISEGKHGLENFDFHSLNKQSNPDWGRLIEFFAQKGLRSFQIANCSMGQNAEYWNTILGQNPIGACKLQVLNLSSNMIGISGAKRISSAFEHNTSIQFLDISNNQLQVYGTHLLCLSLQKNRTLKGLNLFKNNIDVEGCRALRQLFSVNQCIEFLDIGHNRIRAKGLEAISEGINMFENSNLKTLGLRMNFLTDDSIQLFMNDVVFSRVGQLQNLYIKFNNITDSKTKELKAILDQQQSQLYVDEFEKVVHKVNENARKRTVWWKSVTNLDGKTRKSVIQEFKQNCPRLGLLRNIFFKRGQKIRGMKKERVYFFAEFEDDRSVKKCMKMLLKQTTAKEHFGYLTGSNSYVQFRKSVKGAIKPINQAMNKKQFRRNNIRGRQSVSRGRGDMSRGRGNMSRGRGGSVSR